MKVVSLLRAEGFFLFIRGYSPNKVLNLLIYLIYSVLIKMKIKSTDDADLDSFNAIIWCSSAVLPGGVGTCGACDWDSPMSVVERMVDCCCLWANWLSTADGSGWSLISTVKRLGINLNIYITINSTTVHCILAILSLTITQILIVLNLQCWAVTGPFSTRWAFKSTEGEEAGAGLCIRGGPASLETVLLLAAVDNVWLALWPRRGPLSCSDVLMSEAGDGFGAFREPKPEPRTEDWEGEKKNMMRIWQ